MGAFVKGKSHTVIFRRDSLAYTPPEPTRLSEQVWKAREAIEKDNLEEFLKIYESLGIPPRAADSLGLDLYAYRAAYDGRLDDYLHAMSLLNREPESFHLLCCAEAVAERGEDPTRAYDTYRKSLPFYRRAFTPRRMRPLSQPMVHCA